MEILLEKLIPVPMIEIPTDQSEIWESERFIFEPGKSYLVEAASGKGKTSLLAILYGLRKDFRGKLMIDGAESSTLSLKDWSNLRKRKLSFIFQGLELFDDLSALDNLLLKNRITAHKSESEIREMAGLLEVENFLHRKCGILSFGQRQRIAIIRSLCQPFEYLLADECFSHIDNRVSELAMELIRKECATQESGIILTSLGNKVTDFDRRVML